MYKVKEYGPSSSDRVIFIFSGVGVPAWQLQLPFLPLWHFKRAGWKIVYYQYPWKVISSASIYLETIEGVYVDAVKRLSQIPQNKKILVTGISLGSLPATRLATSSHRITGLILNVPYSDPITNLYDFGPTRRVPKDFAERFLKNVNTQDFEKEVSKFSPLQNAKRMKHLKVLLFVARNDKFFLYNHSKKLRMALKKNSKQFTSFEATSLGHYLGASKYNLRSSKWLKWLKF